MTLFHVYYNPITEFDRLFDDAPATRLCPRARAPLADAKQAMPRHSDSEFYCPRMDLHESKDGDTDSGVKTATFELPGLTSDDVTIEVHQNKLTISGERASSDPEEGQGYYVVRERRSGKFSRTLQLPFGTRPEDVKAKMENGILTVTFPKTTPEQQAKRIIIE